MVSVTLTAHTSPVFSVLPYFNRWQRIVNTGIQMSDFLQKSGIYCCAQASSFFNGQVLITTSGVTHARRAMPSP